MDSLLQTSKLFREKDQIKYFGTLFERFVYCLKGNSPKQELIRFQNYC